MDGETIQFETVYDYRGMGNRHIEVWYYPRIEEDGLIHGVVALTRDITDRRQVEESLEKSEQRFRSLFEQAGGYCMILDPNTPDGIPIIVDANESAYTMHGYTREEFIGRPVADIDDAASKKLVVGNTQQIMTGKPFFTENVHLRKDGEV